MNTKTSFSIKRNKVQLNSLNSKSKKPTLMQHTSKIQERLAKLKLQVNEKKSTMNKNRFSAQNKTRIQKNKQKPKNATGYSEKFVSQKNHVKQKGSDIPSDTTMVMQKDLENFITKLGMVDYKNILLENGIDSLSVLEQIKQKQLEQIGISKGHALKIVINVKKINQQQKQTKSTKNIGKETLKDFNKKNKDINSQINKNNQKSQEKLQEPKKQSAPLQIVIQTDPTFQQPLPKRRYFCLFCYKSILGKFCDEDCQDSYNRMFQKYQKNLQKAQQLFLKKPEEPKEQQQQQKSQMQDQDFVDVNDLDFLDFANNKNQYEDEYSLDNDEYHQALEMIKNSENERQMGQMEEMEEKNMLEY